MQTQIDKLLAFKQRNKFSTQAWNDRGLNSSDTALCERLTTLFNNCADNLIAAINQNISPRQLKPILKNCLASFKQSDFDTEEKEFICDLFYELATIIKIDFGDDINKWMYGAVITNLIKLKKVIKSKNVIETLRQPCTKCGTDLETHVIQREKGIPETSWLVAKCNNCGELNLLSHGADIKQIRFGNYERVDRLRMDEYTYEQALTRLEQIKFFRK